MMCPIGLNSVPPGEGLCPIGLNSVPPGEG